MLSMFGKKGPLGHPLHLSNLMFRCSNRWPKGKCLCCTSQDIYLRTYVVGVYNLVEPLQIVLWNFIMIFRIRSYLVIVIAYLDKRT